MGVWAVATGQRVSEAFSALKLQQAGRGSSWALQTEALEGRRVWCETTGAPRRWYGMCCEPPEHGGPQM